MKVTEFENFANFTFQENNFCTFYYFLYDLLKKIYDKINVFFWLYQSIESFNNPRSPINENTFLHRLSLVPDGWFEENILKSVSFCHTLLHCKSQIWYAKQCYVKAHKNGIVWNAEMTISNSNVEFDNWKFSVHRCTQCVHALQSVAFWTQQLNKV